MFFTIYLFVSLISTLYAFEPSCTSCKFFIPHKTNPDLGLCKMFQDRIYNDKLVKNLAKHCRNNEDLCGKDGFLYESIENKLNNDIEKYENIKNMCCGELIEKKDLEELEELEIELLETFQRMRKHNTKIVYRTANDIYNAFKNKKQ